MELAYTCKKCLMKLTYAIQGVEWLEQSCLTLNISQTKGIFFSKNKMQTQTAHILIKNESFDMKNLNVLESF